MKDILSEPDTYCKTQMRSNVQINMND